VAEEATEMRRFARRVVMMGLIALTPIAARANTITKDFTVGISGRDNRNFPTSFFDKFNPSLGTLTSISQTLTGSTIWTAPPTAIMFMTLFTTGAIQIFSPPGRIAIDISGSTTRSSALTELTGTGQFSDTLMSHDINSNGSFSTARLDGTITYDYTPAAPSSVPEPMSITLLGTALLGLGAISRQRRRG
jgi:hypothetical protein